MPQDTSPVPKVELSLFDQLTGGKKTEDSSSSAQAWREELQQKMKEYRARRDGPRKDEDDKEILTTPLSTNPAVQSNIEGELAELDSKFPLQRTEKGKSEESFDWLDEKFRVRPNAVSSRVMEPEMDLTTSWSPAANLPDPALSPGPPPSPAKSFELPESVQRIKQQRQSPRRSDLFQHPLLFEGPDKREETPSEETRLPLPYPAAPTRDRFLAGCFDLIIIGAVEVFCLLPILGMAWLMHWPLSLTPKSIINLLATGIVLALGYCFFFTALTSQTWGMHRRQLTLVTFSGKTLTMKDSILRTLGYLVSAGSLLLGFLWVLFDMETLAWHDRISRTYPVHIRDVASK